MILGISGYAGAGKDEFASIATKEYNAIRLAFADAVKEETEEFLIQYNIPYEKRNLWGTQKDKEEMCIVSKDNWYPNFFFKLLTGSPDVSYGPSCFMFTYRWLMQVWGTEYRRAQDADYWVKKTMSCCKMENQLYVVSDCRFENEANAILDSSGRLVKIERPDRFNITNTKHASEIGLDGWKRWDYTIMNDSNLEDFHNHCRVILNKIMGL